MGVRVGIDLVAVDAVRDALAAHPDRYLRRIFTDAEVADCTTPDGPDAERLAARFAAKEATMKVLRPARDVGVGWRAIGVIREPSGAPSIELHGSAAALAADAGVRELAVSLTHEAGFASAVVVAETDRRNP